MLLVPTMQLQLFVERRTMMTFRVSTNILSYVYFELTTQILHIFLNTQCNHIQCGYNTQYPLKYKVMLTIHACNVIQIESDGIKDNTFISSFLVLIFILFFRCFIFMLYGSQINKQFCWDKIKTMIKQVFQYI